MSYGALSAPAVQAINRGVHIAGCMQNTGEGGISDHHKLGGDLVYNFGTGYFGCRDARGRFDLERFEDTVAGAPVRMIEVKLSQGAKPGVGGVLPAAKVTAEIARIRGIPVGQDCISPSFHTAFGDPGIACTSSYWPRRRGFPWASSPRWGSWTSGRPWPA